MRIYDTSLLGIVFMNLIQNKGSFCSGVKRRGHPSIVTYNNMKWFRISYIVPFILNS